MSVATTVANIREAVERGCGNVRQVAEYLGEDPSALWINGLGAAIADGYVEFVPGCHAHSGGHSVNCELRLVMA